MKTAVPALFLTATFLLLAPTVFSQEKIARWHDSLERAQAASRGSGKPLFVVFRCVR